MTKETKEVLKKRVVSFLWRLAGMVAVAVLNFIATQLSLFNLPPSVVGIISLIVGEITKYINVNLPELKKAKSE